MITVFLEDHGQDFLEWDIEDGVVVACRPFQDWLWNGTKVHNTHIFPGNILEITTKEGKNLSILYPVEKVVEKASV